MAVFDNYWYRSYNINMFDKLKTMFNKKQAEQKDAKEIVEAMYKTRQYFLEGLSTFSIYGKGWSRRNEHVKATAIDMI